MEGTHGQLRTGFADGLRGNNADRLADIHIAAVRQVHAVAAGAYAVLAAAGKHRTHRDGLDASLADQRGLLVVDRLVQCADHFARLGIDDILGSHATLRAVFQGFHFADGFDLDAAHLFAGALEAIQLAHDDLLRHVHQAPRQVARVRRAQRRIGKALARATAGDEVLEDGKSLAEVLSLK